MTIDREAIRARQKQNLAHAEERVAAMGGKAGYFSLRECKTAADRGNIIRVLFPPRWDPVKHDPYVATQKYNLPMEGKQYGQDFYCPAFYDLPDPVKEKREALLAQGADPKSEEIKDLGPRDEYVMLVLDCETDEGIAKGPQVFKFGVKLLKEFLNVFTNDDYFTDTEGPIWDAEKGFDLYVRRTGSGYTTEYSVTPKRNSSPLPNLEAVMAAVAEIDLLRFITVETEETLLDVMAGEYDKDVAKQRRKERDQALGNPVQKLFWGEDQPNPTEADSPGTATGDSAQSTAGPTDTGSTQKTVSAKPVAQTGRKGNSVSKETQTLTATETAQTGTTGAGQAMTDGKMTSHSKPDVETLNLPVGTAVSFVEAGQTLNAEITGLDPEGYIIRLQDGTEGILPPDLVKEVQLPSDGQPDPVNPSQRKAFGDRISAMANE